MMRRTKMKKTTKFSLLLLAVSMLAACDNEIFTLGLDDIFFNPVFACILFCAVGVTYEDLILGSLGGVGI
jgi:hypothetical protein